MSTTTGGERLYWRYSARLTGGIFAKKKIIFAKFGMGFILANLLCEGRVICNILYEGYTCKILEIIYICKILTGDYSKI